MINILILTREAIMGEIVERMRVLQQQACPNKELLSAVESSIKLVLQALETTGKPRHLLSV